MSTSASLKSRREYLRKVIWLGFVTILRSESTGALYIKIKVGPDQPRRLWPLRRKQRRKP